MRWTAATAVSVVAGLLIVYFNVPPSVLPRSPGSTIRPSSHSALPLVTLSPYSLTDCVDKAFPPSACLSVNCTDAA